MLSADAQVESEPLWRFPAIYTEASHLEADAVLPFERLGPYRVLSRIASGGMGSVYLAERDYDGVRGQVAIKVIPRYSWTMKPRVNFFASGRSWPA